MPDKKETLKNRAKWAITIICVLLSMACSIIVGGKYSMPIISTFVIYAMVFASVFIDDKIEAWIDRND